MKTDITTFAIGIGLIIFLPILPVAGTLFFACIFLYFLVRELKRALWPSTVEAERSDLPESTTPHPGC